MPEVKTRAGRHPDRAPHFADPAEPIDALCRGAVKAPPKQSDAKSDANVQLPTLLIRSENWRPARWPLRVRYPTPLAIAWVMRSMISGANSPPPATRRSSSAVIPNLAFVARSPSDR